MKMRAIEYDGEFETQVVSCDNMKEFRELFDFIIKKTDFYSYLSKAAFKFLDRNNLEPEDIVQQTFLTFFKSYENKKGYEELRGKLFKDVVKMLKRYMRIIMFNICIDNRKYSGRHPHVLDNDVLETLPDTTSLPADETFERKNDLEQVLNFATNNLSQRLRKDFVFSIQNNRMGDPQSRGAFDILSERDLKAFEGAINITINSSRISTNTKRFRERVAKKFPELLN